LIGINRASFVACKVPTTTGIQVRQRSHYGSREDIVRKGKTFRMKRSSLERIDWLDVLYGMCGTCFFALYEQWNKAFFDQRPNQNFDDVGN
jgi:hypothetical protein